MRSEFFSVSQKLEVRSGGQWKTSFDPLEVCLWCLWGPYHPTTCGAFWHPVKMLLRLHEPGWHRLQDASSSLSQAIKLLGIGKRLVTAHIRKSSMPCSQPQSSFQALLLQTYPHIALGVNTYWFYVLVFFLNSQQHELPLDFGFVRPDQWFSSVSNILLPPSLLETVVIIKGWFLSLWFLEVISGFIYLIRNLAHLEMINS